MQDTKILHSTDPDTDTLKCPKCNALWRAKGGFDFGDDRWTYDNPEEAFCPCGCTNFLGFRIRGKVVYR